MEKRTLQNEQGEILNPFYKKEWMGKEIKVMPYLKSATEKVCQQTLVMKKVIIFMGGAGDKKSFLGFGQPVLWKAFNLYLNQR